MLFGHRSACDSIKDYPAAIKYYQAASELNPFSIDAMSCQGLIYEKMGDNLEAIRCFKKVLRREKTNFQATEKIGFLYFKTN